MSRLTVIVAGLIVTVTLAAGSALAMCPNCPPPPRTAVEEQADPLRLLELLPDRGLRVEIDALRRFEDLRAVRTLPDPAVLRAAAENADLDRMMGEDLSGPTPPPVPIEREGWPVAPCTNVTVSCYASP